MNRPSYEVADVLRQYGDRYCQRYFISPEQLKVMHLLKICRTSALGGHLEKCDHCAYERPAYNSCRNRHCPKCQALTQEKWLADRRCELLPTGYFHVVFTLPHLLNPIIGCNKKQLLNVLFQSVNETLSAFAKDPQWRLEGKIGFIGVLHTWSQTLMDHYHLHCLIPAGALSFDETRWKPARKRFLFRTRSLALAFKRCYLRRLRRLYAKDALIFPGKTAAYATPEAFTRLLTDAAAKQWIVYAKRPFAGPAQVLRYLGRYTHRVAISNSRIKSLHNDQVVFAYRDRAHQNRKKHMTLPAVEFIRRFMLHVLPDGFMKIRYYGFLSHRHKKRNIALIRNLIDPGGHYPAKIHETLETIMQRLTGRDIKQCPQCGQGKLYKAPLPVNKHPPHVEPADTS